MNSFSTKAQEVILVLVMSLAMASSQTSHNDIRGLSPKCKGNSCPKPKSPQKQEFRPKSCLDYLKRGASKCGIYKIYDNNGRGFPVYCDMKTEPGNAWTLVMSWSNKHRALYHFKAAVFKFNYPVNENAPNWNLYRLTLTRMQSIKSHSTHWRSTCSYPTHGVDYRDYVRGNFKDFDIMTYLGVGVCKKVEYVNIRGHVGIHRSAKWWQVVHIHTLHIDSSAKGCTFNPSGGAVSSEDNFGYYVTINPKFRCTANDQATTQWWFGGHI